MAVDVTFYSELIKTLGVIGLIAVLLLCAGKMIWQTLKDNQKLISENQETLASLIDDTQKQLEKITQNFCEELNKTREEHSKDREMFEKSLKDLTKK